MPIYEYRCEGCGVKFEELMRLSDPAPDCPGCGTSEVRRLMSNTSFQLKGSGWYVTDYKSGGQKSDKSETAKSDSADSGSSDSSGAGSSDSGAEKASSPKVANDTTSGS